MGVSSAAQNHYAERSAGICQHTTVARLDRAMACLRFTGQRTRNAWLKSLCQRKWWEAASAQKLRSCGYHISLRTTRDWRIW